MTDRERIEDTRRLLEEEVLPRLMALPPQPTSEAQEALGEAINVVTVLIEVSHKFVHAAHWAKHPEL
jgi:hypothetical protein